MELYNGVKIPEIGYGTWQTPDGITAAHGVKVAVECGYRHIDTAACYENEKGVGQGIAESVAQREKLFVTSKVWNTERSYNKTLKAFERTRNDLGLDYLDLYLVHWPAAPHMYQNWEEINLEVWSAMIELYKAGKVKAIGVSNFKPKHLGALMKTEVKPMVNQIEFHPGMPQEKTRAFCKENRIIIEAWSPLGCGRLLKHPELGKIAAKYNKSIAQICIRYALQKGVIPLPKSVTPSRIKENINVYGFEIDQKDILKMDRMENVGWSGLDPDTVDF